MRTSLALLALASFAAPAAHAGEAPPARAHELGWLCVNVSDVNVSQVSAFNKDAPALSIWVPKARLFVEKQGPGEAGRVCAPTVVRLGEGPLPPETLVFERTVISGAVQKPSLAELVVTPENPKLAEVTTELVGLPEQWTQRDGTLTFQSSRPIEFPERVLRGLVGDGEGPPPPDVFRALPAFLRFDEPCQPVEVVETVVASFGNRDPRTGKVSARGIEPFRILAGTRVSRCEGVSLDTLMVAIARPASDREDEGNANWYLVPHDAKLKVLSPDREDAPGLRFTAQSPLGGYHVCRQPTWTSSTLTEVPLAGSWELLASGEWRQNLPGDRGANGSLTPGLGVTLLDHRDTWALVRAVLDGEPRIIAAPASSIAMPTGPASDSFALDSGLCPVARGQWRALKATAQAFKVSQDTPGAELAGLWLEIPLGTHVLQLCQDGPTDLGKRAPGQLACAPIYVGGAQSSETERFVLVRYAGAILALRERDLRDRTTGEYALRRERPWYYRADSSIKKEEDPHWTLALGPGGRISFVHADDHAWTLTARLQRLTEETLGFEGQFGVGGDGASTFMSLAGGVGALLHRFEEESLELRGAVLGQLDLRVSRDGGLNFQVIGKAQLRWVNEYAPVSLELGLNLGYGGTFGADGRGGVMFGMPISVLVEVIEF